MGRCFANNNSPHVLSLFSSSDFVRLNFLVKNDARCNSQDYLNQIRMNQMFVYDP